MFIPGLDEVGKDGKIVKTNIFDLLSPPNAPNFKIDRMETMEVEKGNVSTLQTMFNVLKVFLGIGIMTTPASFKLVGLVGGSVLICIIGVVACYTMML